MKKEKYGPTSLVPHELILRLIACRKFGCRFSISTNKRGYRIRCGHIVIQSSRIDTALEQLKKEITDL